MLNNQFEVIIFYKYVPIDSPEKLAKAQKELWAKLNLKGRMIIAAEGVNATLEGNSKDIKKYVKEVKKDPRFSDLFIKSSPGNGQSFPKPSIKVRKEIVATHINEDLDPNKTTGKYLTAEKLHEWFETGKKFYIVDMRNDYEQISGHFEGSILSDFKQFYDLPQILPKLEYLKDETILTVCTAGVRCEKASGFLVKHGFSDVYQLYGGIHTYMQQYPNENFNGVLYVFDNRLIVGFNLEDETHQVIGKCFKCGAASEDYQNCAFNFCHYHTIVCSDCLNPDGNFYCTRQCELNYLQNSSSAAV